MILKFDKEINFILMHFNSENIAMELENLFSYCSMGEGSIVVDELSESNLMFSCKFDEGNRRFFEIFCRRIGKNIDLEDYFCISSFEIINMIHSFICDRKSIGGYFSSAALNGNQYYFTLSFSDNVFNRIKKLSGSELSKLKKESSNNNFCSILDLNGELETCDSNWEVVKKIQQKIKVEECSSDFFISKIKDCIYDFYEIPDRINLVKNEKGLVCDLFEGDKPTRQLSFYDNDFDTLVRNAFFEPSASLESFRYDLNKECWLISYISHC